MFSWLRNRLSFSHIKKIAPRILNNPLNSREVYGGYGETNRHMNFDVFCGFDRLQLVAQHFNTIRSRPGGVPSVVAHRLGPNGGVPSPADFTLFRIDNNTCSAGHFRVTPSPHPELFIALSQALLSLHNLFRADVDTVIYTTQKSLAGTATKKRQCFRKIFNTWTFLGVLLLTQHALIQGDLNARKQPHSL